MSEKKEEKPDPSLPKPDKLEPAKADPKAPEDPKASKDPQAAKDPKAPVDPNAAVDPSSQPDPSLSDFMVRRRKNKPQ
jgi:hypothetical protein